MTSTDEDYEKMTKILFIDFDNSVLEFISPEQEKELKIWKDIVKTEEYWAQLIKNELQDEQCKAYFEPLPFDKKKAFFMFGVACIISFVQANFTGPHLAEELKEYLNSGIFKKADFSTYLKVNLERINPNTNFPCLLTAAKLIFKNCRFNALVNVWWGLRSIIIQQLIMDELCPSLLQDAQKLQKETADFKMDGHVKAKFEIEQAQLLLLYRQVEKAEKHIETACDILGLKYTLNEKKNCVKNKKAEVSLEVMLVERENINRPPVHKFPVPQNITLNEPMKMDTVNYLDNRKQHMLFPNTEQKLLLTVIHYLVVSKPPNQLQYKELKGFIEVILSQNNTWTVRTATLLLREKIEEAQNKKLDRSIAQLEEVLNCYKKDRPHRLTRIGGVYGTCLQPIWRTQYMYADFLLKAGKVQPALDTFIKIDEYQKMLECLAILKKDKKSQVSKVSLLKKKYQHTKDERYLCFLGDLTKDPSCYENAWILSKKRSFRAQRHWGLHFYNLKQHEEAISHLEKSVSINPLQHEVWLKMGMAAMACEQWQTAATALRRYTAYEPSGTESWCNLAEAYMNLNNKRSAHTAYSECLRCNSKNWRIWEKLLVVSAEISHFSDIIRAYHKLLNLKDKYLNTEVLGVLVYGVTNNSNDVEGRPAQELSQKACGLVGRLVTMYPNDGLIWELYANLAPVLELKGLRLQRAFQAYTSINNWKKNAVTSQHVIHVCRKLGEIVVSPEIDPCDELLHTAKKIITEVNFARREIDNDKDVDDSEWIKDGWIMLGRILAKSASCLR